MARQRGGNCAVNVGADPICVSHGLHARRTPRGAWLRVYNSGALRLHRKTPFSPDADEPRGDRPLIFLLPPFLALCVYLLCTHTLSSYGGGLYSGQCSYGDMCMHLGFITSMAEQGNFPFEYSILPGSRLCYPFLCDSVSASLYLLGLPLRAAYIVPMVFALAQVFCGGWFLGREIVHRRGAAVLAFILFFLNGGLGMIYFMGDYSLTELFTGFYTTPTNLTDRGIRWVNVICDMMIPQRTLLAGWTMVIPALYLLYPCSWILTALAEIAYFAKCYKRAMAIFRKPAAV